MNLSELKRKKMSELVHMGSELNIEGVSGMRRQDLIFALAGRPEAGDQQAGFHAGRLGGRSLASPSATRRFECSLAFAQRKCQG